MSLSIDLCAKGVDQNLLFLDSFDQQGDETRIVQCQILRINGSRGDNFGQNSLNILSRQTDFADGFVTECLSSRVGFVVETLKGPDLS